MMYFNPRTKNVYIKNEAIELNRSFDQTVSMKSCFEVIL